MHDGGEKTPQKISKYQNENSVGHSKHFLKPSCSITIQISMYTKYFVQIKQDLKFLTRFHWFRNFIAKSQIMIFNS